MSSTDAPNWWADVQQEREDLAGSGRRPADDWLGEDIDFVPRRGSAARQPPPPTSPPHRGSPPTATAPPTRCTASSSRLRLTRPSATRQGHPAEGAAAPVGDERRAARPSAPSRTIELTTGDDELVVATPADVAHELAHLSAADDPFATPPPPAGTRRTVQIKGRPAESRMPSMAQRHRGRTASDRVGARPDRIALWAVALGAILILLAAMTSSSQAAVVDHAATTPAASAHVVHAAAPLPAPLRH